MQTLAAPATADRNVSLYPEHWLANIRLLLRDNQRAAALRSLDEFRKKYPDYVLPDDLPTCTESIARLARSIPPATSQG